MNFALRIKTLRENNNLSQKQLSQKFNIAASTVGMWESDDRIPPAPLLVKIADYFNVSLDYLLGRSDKENTFTIQNIARGGEMSEEILTQGEVETVTWLIQNKDKNAVIFFREGQIAESIELPKEKITPAISLIKTLKEVR